MVDFNIPFSLHMSYMSCAENFLCRNVTSARQRVFCSVYGFDPGLASAPDLYIHIQYGTIFFNLMKFEPLFPTFGTLCPETCTF